MFLLFLLLLTPGAEALTGLYEAAEIEATGASGHGSMAYLSLQGEGAVPRFESLALHATDLTIAGWYRDSRGLPIDVDGETVWVEYHEGPAELTTQRAIADYRLVVEGAEGLFEVHDALHLVAHGESTRPYPSYIPVPDRDNRSFDVASTVQYRLAEPHLGVLQAPFTLMLWNWNLTFDTPQGTVEAWSGFRPHTEQDPLALQGHDRQLLVIEVRSGYLELPLEASYLDAFFADIPELMVEGAMVLRGATGIDGAEADDGRVTAEGRHRLALDALSGGLLRVQVTEAEEIVNQAPETQATPETDIVAPESSPSGLTLPATLAILVLAATLALFLHREWTRRCHDRLDEAMSLGHFDFVLRRGPALHGHRRYGEKAQLWTAVAMIRSGKTKQALRLIPDLDRIGIPMQDYLKSWIHAKEGQDQQALDCLGKALEAAPELRAEAARSPALAALLAVPPPAPEGGYS